MAVIFALAWSPGLGLSMGHDCLLYKVDIADLYKSEVILLLQVVSVEELEDLPGSSAEKVRDDDEKYTGMYGEKTF